MIPEEVKDPKESKENKIKEMSRQLQMVSSALTEQIMLRDVLLLINTANNPYDRGIVEKLIKGDKLDQGEWQHVFGEAGRLNLPEAHAAAMQALYTRLSRNADRQ